MAVRIEYFLLLSLAVLIASIMGIKPISQEAINAIDDKELRFEDFVVSEIKEDMIGEKISASKATKYKEHLDMENLKFNDALGAKITAKKGVYKNDIIYMTDNVYYRNEKGFRFLTQSLNYDLSQRSVQTMSSFVLDYNKSKVFGKQLKYDSLKQKILADNITARIYFTPK